MFWTLIISQLKNILRWVTDPKNRTIMLFIGIIISGVFMFQQHNRINKLLVEKQTYSSNAIALTDSLQDYKTDNGDLIAQKGALQTSKYQLKILNNELYVEIQKEKDKPPKTITKIQTVVRRDTVFTNSSEYEYLGESAYRITWEYKESGEWGLRALKGNSRFNFLGDSTISNIRSQITKDIFQMSISTGFRETPDGNLQAFARTSAPNVTFTQVDGAIIDPNSYINIPQKRWGIGFHIGWGLSSEFKPTPYIGVGLSYDVFSF